MHRYDHRRLKIHGAGLNVSIVGRINNARRVQASDAGLALASILCVQIGAAASTSLFAKIGPAGAAWLRLCWAAAIFVMVARPWPWPTLRRHLGSTVALGLVTAGMAVLFFEAIARIPLATAVTLEFLGPLAVAVLRRSGRWGLAWPPLAFAGVLLVTQPWHGLTNSVGLAFAMGAAVCWAGYILLTQHLGNCFSGVSGLAISMPIAALAVTPIGAPQAIPHLTMIVIVQCAGLALLLPVLPYALEFVALRQLTVATFGTLMSIEPAVALIVGAFVLGQIPNIVQVIGILFITAVAIGTVRTGQHIPNTRGSETTGSG